MRFFVVRDSLNRIRSAHLTGTAARTWMFEKNVHGHIEVADTTSVLVAATMFIAGFTIWHIYM